MPPLHGQALVAISHDVRAFHAPYGLYFSDTMSHEWESTSILPQKATGGVATNYVTLTRYDPDRDCLELAQLSKWLPNFRITFLPYTVESAAVYDLDPDTGWPHTVSPLNISIVGGQGQTEELELESAPPDQ